MAVDARAILRTMSGKELKDLASSLGIDTAKWKGKADHVERLSGMAEVMARVNGAEYRVRPSLAEKSIPQLRAIAKEHGVDLAGAKTKADFVSRLAASPAALKILAGSAIEGPSRAPAAVRSEGDSLLLQGRNLDVDFGLVEDVLDQARMRFEERNYDRALELAREAMLLARGTLDAFEKAAWAYAVEAADRLIRESGRVGRDVEPAGAILRDVKVAYVSGNLWANQDLLAKLPAATKSLYSEEVRRVRDALYGAQDRIAQTKHVGGDVAAAEESLARADDAMRRGEHAKSLELVGESERLAGESLARRVREIETRIPATERIVEEAKHVGADVSEANRLLDKARVAMQRKEYVLAAELVQRAERSALQAQHYQIQRAMDLRMRQIEKAQGIVNYLLPIIDEAASYEMDIEEARAILADARAVLDQGDYVNGTLLAKRGEEVVLALVPRLAEERPKRGIVKPTAGRCTACGSSEVLYLEDGWSKCSSCGAQWRWRMPSGLWERFRSLLRE